MQMKIFHLRISGCFSPSPPSPRPLPATSTSLATGSGEHEQRNARKLYRAAHLRCRQFRPRDGSSNGGLSCPYSDYGGERFHLVFGNDTAATYFVYDNLCLSSQSDAGTKTWSSIWNQVTANGEETIIFGTQCSSISGTWEYTYASSGHGHWRPSNIPCKPTELGAQTKWHHIQIQSHRVGGMWSPTTG